MTTEALSVGKSKVSALKGFMGFDGFIDEIISVVNKRKDAETYSSFATISEFANRVQSASGKSSNIELVTKQAKIGGNGPIMGLSLASLGLDLTYVGALGEDSLHPVFKKLEEKCSKVYTLCDAGHTDALEFSDGKLMFGKLESLKEVNWANLIKVIGESTIQDYIKNSDFFSFVNWTMLPYMSDIWNEFSKSFATLRNSRDFPVFIDLADFEKRTDEDCLEAIEIMREMNKHATVTLGLNLREGQQMARLLKYTGTDDEDIESVKRLAAFIRKDMELETVCVHPRNFAVSADSSGTYGAVGPYTDKPKISTGAGDHFNAGYFAGTLIGLTQQQALTLGVLNSGYYVRTAISGNLDDLGDFCQLWNDGRPEDICN
jgi:sugar/nucleoside kinase (ribokinase family)